MQRPMERQREQAQRTFFAAQWTTHRVVRSEAERTGLLRKAFPVCTPINAPLSSAGTQFRQIHLSAQPGENFRLLPAIRGGGPLVQLLGAGFQRRGPRPPAFVPRGGMGDGGLHRHGVTIPGPGGPSIVPFPRKRAAFSAAGGAWPAFPHVSGGGLRGRDLCAKDSFPLPCSGNYPLREQRE